MPSGTSAAASGESGPGASIPAAAQEASRPGSWRSSTATRKFSAASSKAIELPISPPPTMITSNAPTDSYYQELQCGYCDRGPRARAMAAGKCTKNRQGQRKLATQFQIGREPG